MTLTIIMLKEKSQTQKSLYYKILFMQNSGKSKLPCGYRRQISHSVELGAEEKMDCKHAKETSGDDGNVPSVDF